jgi:hypothetical protein
MTHCTARKQADGIEWTPHSPEVLSDGITSKWPTHAISEYLLAQQHIDSFSRGGCVKMPPEDDVNKQRPTRTDESGDSHQHDVFSKERLDDWLDDALADTFPASDPVASPPSGPALVEGGDRAAPNESTAGAPSPPRSRG